MLRKKLAKEKVSLKMGLDPSRPMKKHVSEKNVSLYNLVGEVIGQWFEVLLSILF